MFHENHEITIYQNTVSKDSEGNPVALENTFDISCFVDVKSGTFRHNNDSENIISKFLIMIFNKEDKDLLDVINSANKSEFKVKYDNVTYSIISINKLERHIEIKI